MKNKYKENNAKLILIIIVAIVILAGIFMWQIVIPKYNLNIALNYIDNKNYKEAYSHIQKYGKQKDKQLIDNIIINIFFDRQTNFVDEMSSIFKEITDIFKEESAKIKNKEIIDYSKDDIVTEKIDKLNEYAKDVNIFPKDIFPEYFSESYDKYFDLITDVMLYCRNPLDSAKSNTQLNQYSSNLTNLTNLSIEIAEEMFKISIKYDFKQIPNKYKTRYNI